MEIFKLFGSILIDNAKADESISKTESKAQMLGKALSAGIKTAGKWALGIAGGVAAAGTALFALANETAKAADEIDKLSERTGINREELQRWKYAAGQSGADIGKLEVGMKTLSEAMVGASDGSKKNVEAFEALGISIDSLKTKSQEDIFAEVMSALADMPQGAERNALGNDLLGKSYTELMPLLNAGSEGMEALKKRADELGIVLSEEAVKANVVFGDSLADVQQSVGAVTQKLTTAFLPILMQILTWVLDHMPEIQDVIGTVFGVVSSVVEGAWKWMDLYLLPVFEKLFTWTRENWPAISATIKEAIDIIMPLFISFWELIFNDILPILKALWDFISPTFPLIGAVIKTAFEGVVLIAKDVISVFDAIAGAIKTAIGWLTGWNNTEPDDKTANVDFNTPTEGRFATGLDYVPYNGFIAELHEGERVLTKEQARKGDSNGLTQNITIISPTPLSPSETARQLKNASRDLAMEG